MWSFFWLWGILKARRLNRKVHKPDGIEWIPTGLRKVPPVKRSYADAAQSPPISKLILCLKPNTLPSPPHSKSIPKYHLSKADWDQFAADLDAAVSKMPIVLPENACICHDNLIEAFIVQLTKIFRLKNVIRLGPHLELLASLDHLKNSAPGPDSIPYAFLAKSGQVTKKYFLDLLNHFLDLGFVPEAWKKQIIIPLHKQGKDPLLPSSHRPIALSSCLLKILEHMIKKRLEWFVESNKILSKSQFGFRRGMGTMDSLSILTTDIRISLSRNEFLVGVFLDVSSAYDSVILSLLRDKLSKLSLPQKLTHFICNFLMERSIEVRHNGSHSTPRLIWQGLPQGSVLSPLLYSLYTHDLDEAVSPFCNILQYADDIALYASSHSVEVATCNLNQALFYLEPCNKVALGKLDKIQYQSLRVILGAMKSSPTNALQVEATDPPLYLRRQYLADRFFLRLSLLDDHPLLPKLQELSDLITDSGFWFNKNPPCLINSFRKFNNLPDPSFTCSLLPLFAHSYDALIFQPNIILNFGITKNQPGANSSFLHNIENSWQGWSLLFTDASRLMVGGAVGSAVWIPKDSVILSFKCPPHTSVFTGELVAILEAVKYINAHGISNSIIFTDSLSGLQSITANPFSAKINYPLVLLIRQSLFEAHLRNLEISLAWIPSHSGIRGNEVADAYAKEAIEIGSLDHSHCYFYDLFSAAKSDLTSLWLRHYECSLLVKGRHYGDIQPNIPPKPWYATNSLPQPPFRNLIQPV
ncbi:uncharacterized protein [Choristoneura fumiferana]|uniref:uncharacterized protein n=1 Tax=Choristoneura fumiferana TaxID=7141 RepID=UPI003D15E6AF